MRMISKSPVLSARAADMLGAAALAFVLVGPLAGCDRGGVASAPDVVPVRFLITNKLLAPVAVSVDGVPVIGLNGGASGGITVPSTARTLAWTSAKPTDAGGHPIADDIAEVKIAVAGIGPTLDISNVIGGRTYITARIFNHTSVPVSIGVRNEAVTSCAAALPASSSSMINFTQTGYYQLLPTTEIRAFRDPMLCSGPSVAWDATELSAFTPGSGSLVLFLERAP